MIYSLNILIFLISVTRAYHTVFCEISNALWSQPEKSLKSCDIVNITNSKKLEPIVQELTYRGWNDYEQWQWKYVYAVTLKMRVNTIPLKIKKYFPNLEVINACCNNLQEIQDGTFRGLTKLKILNFKVNKIKNIEEHAFADLTLLESLHLSYNQLTVIKASILKDLLQLKAIYIDNNFITEISTDMIYKSEQLQTIVIGGIRCEAKNSYFEMIYQRNCKTLMNSFNTQIQKTSNETELIQILCNFNKEESRIKIDQISNYLKDHKNQYARTCFNLTPNQNQNVFHFLGFSLEEQKLQVGIVILFFLVIDLSIAFFCLLCYRN